MGRKLEGRVGEGKKERKKSKGVERKRERRGRQLIKVVEMKGIVVGLSNCTVKCDYQTTTTTTTPD